MDLEDPAEGGDSRVVAEDHSFGFQPSDTAQAGERVMLLILDQALTTVTRRA